MSALWNNSATAWPLPSAEKSKEAGTVCVSLHLCNLQVLEHNMTAQAANWEGLQSQAFGFLDQEGPTSTVGMGRARCPGTYPRPWAHSCQITLIYRRVFNHGMDPNSAFTNRLMTMTATNRLGWADLMGLEEAMEEVLDNE